MNKRLFGFAIALACFVAWFSLTVADPRTRQVIEDCEADPTNTLYLNPLTGVVDCW